MRFLRKTLWVTGLILLLELLKRLFDRVFNEAILFHHNLLTSLQAVILLWLIITLLSEWVIFRKKAASIITRNVFIITFSVIAFPEMLFTYYLHHPSRLPAFLVPVFRRYYGGLQRNIIQFNPSCSVYDSSLFYTLKPSSGFVFDNYEFSDTFYTNRMGLRDDAGSLVKPEIICIGDSYAMGWGVRQPETFAEQLGIRSGKKVLNAAIASYGTVRELKNLYRLDTSNLHYLVIQYCHNDFEENAKFAGQDYSLKISPEKVYDSCINTHYWNKAYFPGKHFITMCKIAGSEKLSGLLRPRKEQSYDSSVFQLKDAALIFVKILLHSAINFNKCKVFVLDLNEKASMNNSFLDEVKALAASSSYREHFNNNLTTVPVADILGPEDYYILDDHLRASGHQKIAGRLDRVMFSQN
ncbi:MAG: hypothetical protein Q8941_12035 [Bacteroidota bacterium]|nr:hypothetical protein [Bacteroidota bacterium]